MSKTWDKKKCAIREYYDLSCNLNPKLFLRQMLKSDGKLLGKPDEILTCDGLASRG